MSTKVVSTPINKKENVWPNCFAYGEWFVVYQRKPYIVLCINNQEKGKFMIFRKNNVVTYSNYTELTYNYKFVRHIEKIEITEK